MQNKSVSKVSGKFSEWMEAFVRGLAGKHFEELQEETNEKVGETQETTEKTNEINLQETNTQEKENEKFAEININDLEKVIWNDETFYVLFDEKGANVINEFGNVVTSLPGLFSVEEVDKALNGKQIVINSSNESVNLDDNDDNEFQTELSKIADSIEKEIEEMKCNEEKTEKEATVEEKDEKGLYDEEFVEALIDGIEELETRLANLESELDKVKKSQEYARKPEFENVDIDAQQKEQKHYEETAANTNKLIEKEHNIDLSTPKGRIELSEIYESEDQSKHEETEVNNNDENNNKDTNEKEEQNQKSASTIEEKIVKLSQKDCNIFKHAICPNCGNKSLVKSKVVKNLQGIYCESCDSEYAVNLDTEEIFHYKNN